VGLSIAIVALVYWSLLYDDCLIPEVVAQISLRDSCEVREKSGLDDIYWPRFKTGTETVEDVMTMLEGPACRENGC